MVSYIRSARRIAWAVLPLACAHGVDIDPSFSGEGGSSRDPSSSATGGSSSGVGGRGTGVGGGSTAATTGTGGQGGETVDAGSDPAATVGTGGTAGTGTGGAGAGGAAGGSGGTGGSSAAGGAGGSAGASGASGAGGTSGNGGSAGGGNGGSGGNAGTGGIADAGMPLKPTSITMGTSMSPVSHAPTSGGTSFNQRCRTDEVLIGYRGTVDSPDATVNYLRSFQAICGTLSITGTTTYAVNTTQAESLPTQGTQTGSISQTAMCPANQVVVGFSGRSGNLVDSLTFSCAPLVISGSSPSFTLSIGPTSDTSTVGGPGGMPFAPVACPVNTIAVGHAGRSNQDVQAFGLVCARPTLQVR